MLYTKVALGRVYASSMESVAETFSLLPFSFWLLLGPGGERSILQWFWKRDNVQAQNGRYCGSIRRSRGAIAFYSSSQLPGKKRGQNAEIGLNTFYSKPSYFASPFPSPVGLF